MFNWFKKKREEEKGEPKNLQLISLCLAFEVAASDNDIDKKEKELILNKIKDDVDTGVLNSDEVFEIIKNENEVKVSFYDLIHEINKNLSKDEKEEVIRLLWETAYADDILEVDEERVVRRSAEMLGIKTSIVLKIKDEVKNN
jgi:uncharacterized tellurite resistance protein B-like protein|tara:strand:- start:55 stop:483 length:429 start_codon:yes stop_codon:yes gene_type:complete